MGNSDSLGDRIAAGHRKPARFTECRCLDKQVLAQVVTQGRSGFEQVQRAGEARQPAEHRVLADAGGSVDHRCPGIRRADGTREQRQPAAKERIFAAQAVGRERLRREQQAAFVAHLQRHVALRESCDQRPQVLARGAVAQARHQVEGNVLADLRAIGGERFVARAARRREPVDAQAPERRLNGHRFGRRVYGYLACVDVALDGLCLGELPLAAHFRPAVTGAPVRMAQGPDVVVDRIRACKDGLGALRTLEEPRCFVEVPRFDLPGVDFVPVENHQVPIRGEVRAFDALHVRVARGGDARVARRNLGGEAVEIEHGRGAATGRPPGEQRLGRIGRVVLDEDEGRALVALGQLFHQPQQVRQECRAVAQAPGEDRRGELGQVHQASPASARCTSARQ